MKLIVRSVGRKASGFRKLINFPCLPLGLYIIFDSRIHRRSSNEFLLGLSHLHNILCNNGYCFKSSSLLCAVGLYTKCLDPQCLIVITELVLLRFTV